MPNAYLTDISDGVLTVTLNRPEAGNAVPPEAVAPLADLFRSVATDTSIRAVLVCGNGANFSAGGDVKGFARSLDQPIDDRRADFGARLDRAGALVEAYLSIPVPIVAACQGGVAGAGMLFALGADIVLVDDTTAFLFAHQRLGLTPDAGVSLLLPRVVGARRATALVLTAAKLNGAEAVAIGLAHRLVANDALQSDAVETVQRLARAPVQVVARAKCLLRPSGRNDLDQLIAERDAIVACVGEADFEEGVRSFIEKRSARFPSAR